MKSFMQRRDQNGSIRQVRVDVEGAQSSRWGKMGPGASSRMVWGRGPRAHPGNPLASGFHSE